MRVNILGPMLLYLQALNIIPAAVVQVQSTCEPAEKVFTEFLPYMARRQ